MHSQQFVPQIPAASPCNITQRQKPFSAPAYCTAAGIYQPLFRKSLRRTRTLCSSSEIRQVKLMGAAKQCLKTASEISPTATRVGWIGTGVMGLSMASHILAAGFKLSVFNRTPSKAAPLVAKGADLKSSPQEVAAASDVVFTIVGYPADVSDVILGASGVLQGLREGGIVVDMSTSQPSLAREIASAAEKIGVAAVDAPVSGGDRGAREASLAIMAGGDGAVVAGLEPLFRCMGRATWMGQAGSGQSCKMANQVTIASAMVGLVEGMLYAQRAGLDVAAYIQAISKGAAGSRSLDLYAERILRRDFDPGFFVKHFVKDLGIALEESRQMNLSLPGLALAQQLYVSLMAHGDGDLGTQSLALALERMNNIQLETSKTNL